MNKNEVLVLTSYVKGMIADNKEPEKKVIVALCDELERVNFLEPVGYMESNGIDYINKHGFTHINVEKSGSINTPLYRLD